MYSRLLFVLCLLLSSLPIRAAPDLLLAKNLPAHVQVPDYLVSEKYDGVRAYWDGKDLWFRGGGKIAAPSWFVEGFPHVALDGELWIGRGQFEITSGIVRKIMPLEKNWKQIKYMVFELPEAQGDFSSRFEQLSRLVQEAHQPHLIAVKQYRLKNRKQLQQKLNQVVNSGGEGLMLHLAKSSYVTGRSDVLYKLKPMFDAEATVVAHLAGKGKYMGQLGALRVRTDDGREFNIGTGFSDDVRRDPPAVGAIVTYRYRGLTNKGLPRFASYWRIRQ